MPAISEASAQTRAVLRYTILGIPVTSTIWLNKPCAANIDGRIYYDNGSDTVPVVGYSLAEQKIREVIDNVRAVQQGGTVAWIGADIYDNSIGTDQFIGSVQYATVGTQPAAEATRVGTFTFKDSFGGNYRIALKGFAKSHAVYRTYPSGDTAINLVFQTFLLDEDLCSRYNDPLTIAKGLTTTTYDKYEKLLGYRR